MVECTPKVLNRRLVLIRHAKSAYPAGVGDHERPLSARGIADAGALRKWPPLRGLFSGEVAVLVSSAKRTQDSWALIGGADCPPHRTEPLLYEAAPRVLLALINTTAPATETLIIVAHNPGLEDLASMIVRNRESTAFVQLDSKFPTCAVAVFEVIDFANVNEGNALLTQFVVPRG